MPLSNSGAINEYPDKVGVPYWWIRGLTNAPDTYFPDSQGVLRVTMLTGEAWLSDFEVTQDINGGFYSADFQVPEPGTGALVMLGLAALGVFRMLRHRLGRDVISSIS